VSGRPREFDDAAVLDAAMDVFWEHGFEATSAEMLCARTGLGRGSLYNAFGSKKKLYEECLRVYHLRAITKKIVVLTGPGTVVMRLRAFLSTCLTAPQDAHAGRICMSVFSALKEGMHEPVIDGMNRQHLGRLEAALLRTFEEGQRNGELTVSRTAADMVKGYIASYYGLCLLGQAMPDPVFFKAALDETLARIVV
jgi:TetR/AcrR family transcriptional repressor of nem operon